MKHGSIQILARNRLRTWRGWVVFSWDMGFEAHLFTERPEVCSTTGHIDFSHSSQRVDPAFLTACGIDVLWDVRGKAGEQFYYGQGSDGHGNHVPIRVNLRLPECLLGVLGVS